MNERISRRIVGGLFPLAFLLCAPPASATVREPEPYSMEVLVDGVPLPEYVARNTSYIEAREGCEYSIRLTNRTAGRIAIAQFASFHESPHPSASDNEYTLNLHLQDDSLSATPTRGFTQVMADRANGSEPIAVVGMALRVPGASTPEQFWRNILDGRDTHDDSLFLGWRTFSSGGLCEREVPGDTFSMLNPPHVRGLCRQLGEILRD